MELVVCEEWNGLTIKKVLLDRLRFSRAAVTALKTREKGILVNGEHKTVRYVLQVGDVLSLHTSDTEPSPRIRQSAGPIEILYEDEDFLAVNKPPNMAVHPSKKLQDDTLAGRILYHRYPMVFRAAGRLDKDTSGVVISAKSQVVSAKFFHLIRAHGIEKEYLVLTESQKEPPREGEIDLCIRRDPESYITRTCFAADGTEKEGETALTRFRLLASRAPYHLFLASPITGRTHQLRAHFSAIGFPLAGDTLYGHEAPIIGRQALHCLRLSFPHPTTGEHLSVTAPLHEDYRAALRAAFGTEPEELLFSKGEAMKPIQSFTVDHDKLLPGLYISRTDGDAVTFDLRTRRPNSGDYMDNLTMHSVEHLFATCVRNGPLSDRVLYFGPMGCQTGFYLICRDSEPNEVKDEILRVLRQILAWDEPMPGGTRKECGNFENLSVEAGKRECARYLAVLEEKEIDFNYEV